MADTTGMGGVMSPAGTPGQNDGTMPADPVAIISQIQDLLGQLSDALGVEEQGEGEAPATGAGTGAETPMPPAPPTDEEIVAGLKKPMPLPMGFGGQGRGR